MSSQWQRTATNEYCPLAAGSIDGTDSRPHDNAVYRAMNCKHTPPVHIQSRTKATIFVSRLPEDITEQELRTEFEKFASVRNVDVIRDIVSGFGKGYAFVELKHEKDVDQVLYLCRGMKIDGKDILLDREVGRTLKGWVPRRMGGGWGGKRETGQLRFGCKDRPWRSPIVTNNLQPKFRQFNDTETGKSRDKQKYSQDDRENYKSLQRSKRI